MSEIKFYNYIGQAVKLVLDEDNFPDACIVFNPRNGEEYENDDILFDLGENPQSKEISEDDYLKLCQILRAHSSE